MCIPRKKISKVRRYHMKLCNFFVTVKMQLFSMETTGKCFKWTGTQLCYVLNYRYNYTYTSIYNYVNITRFNSVIEYKGGTCRSSGASLSIAYRFLHCPLCGDSCPPWHQIVCETISPRWLIVGGYLAETGSYTLQGTAITQVVANVDKLGLGVMYTRYMPK